MKRASLTIAVIFLFSFLLFYAPQNVDAQKGPSSISERAQAEAQTAKSEPAGNADPQKAGLGTGLPGAGLIRKITDMGSMTAGGNDDINMEVYNVRTEDNWNIAIDRYYAKGQKERKGAVILCHGFNFNSTFWNLDRRCSPARYFAIHGYDVFVPSLRGSGQSSKPILSRLRSMAKFDIKSVPEMFIKGPLDIAKFGWTIDDHILKDVPAIIKFAKTKSGFDKVFWIGHSMGGIIAFGYLERVSQDDIAGFMPVGSMIIIPEPLTDHLKHIANQKQLLTASLIVNTTVASQVRNYTMGAVKNPIEELLFERKNMYNDVIFKLFRQSIDDTSAGVVSQFSDSIKKGAIISSNHSYNYTEHLGEIKTPVMIIGGAADGFVTKKVMRDTYDRIGSGDKSIFIFSEGYGFSTNYGHCDLLLGKNSEKEVYPIMLEWVEKRAAKN